MGWSLILWVLSLLLWARFCNGEEKAHQGKNEATVINNKIKNSTTVPPPKISKNPLPVQKVDKGPSLIHVDKAWLSRQKEILTLLNSLHNCKQLSKEMTELKFDMIDHIKEYANETTVKNYVTHGFNDVEHLFEIFWDNWNKSELIYKTGVYLLQKNANPVEFFHAFASVVVNKPDYHKIPPPHDIFSDLLLGQLDDEMSIDDIAKTLNKNKGIEYYLEDPGLLSFYVSWFLYNPIWWKDKEDKISKNRNGELFMYVISQLYARYNGARIAEGNLKELEDWEIGAQNVLIREIDEVLTEKVHQYHDGPIGPNRTNVLDQIGNIILKKFGNGKNYFLELLMVATHESKSWNDLESFYYILKHLNSFALSAKERLMKAYTSGDLKFDGIVLESLKVDYPDQDITGRKEDTFYTNWNHKRFYIKKCNQTATVGKRMLNHANFDYQLKIESLLDPKTNATVDIFLSPKFDFDGKAIHPSDYYKYMFQMDHFEIEIKNGENQIVRSSTSSPLFTRGDHSFMKQLQDVIDAETGYTHLSVANKKLINCGFPSNLMIPKGGGEQQPLKFLLFAIITPSSGHENIFTLCKGANLSKIFPQDLSTSTKSFGFPFDRGFESENVLKDLENYKIVQVDSIMESGEDEYSDSL